jgi:nicotinamidase-related amidase
VKPALLVIDMQARFREGVTADKALSWDDAVGAINAAIGLFAAKGLPVICVEHVDPGTGLVPGAAGFDTDPRILLPAGTPRIHKEFGSAFAGTGLAGILRGLGADAVVVSGYCAEWCVLSSLRGAEPEGFKAMALADGIASGHPARIPFVLEISESISSGALEACLG